MPVYLDGNWGYANQTLTDPSAPTVADSEWGYQSVVLASPTPADDSPWGYAPVTLLNPHHPFAIKIGSTLRYVPIRTKVAGELR